ncbi:hypothetical protein [Streptomyces sp. NPDC056491]|uniref:hypothetical protein n=1 Tax=Streptomyces sp. NPDC056491 TaxID=3345837 RepID=UPI00368D5724
MSIGFGDWYRSIELYHQLCRVSADRACEAVIEPLVQCGLEELRRIAVEPEPASQTAALEPLETLVDFLQEHGAEDELPGEFATVWRRAELVIAAREADRTKWLHAVRTQDDARGRSDALRDRALITELMRNLDDAH